MRVLLIVFACAIIVTTSHVSSQQEQQQVPRAEKQKMSPAGTNDTCGDTMHFINRVIKLLKLLDPQKPLQAEKDSPDDNLLTATTTAPEINRNEYYHGLLNNCSRAQNISVEQYIYASARNNTNGVWELAKCVDECMLKTLSVMKPDGKVDMDLAMEHLLWGEPGLQRNATKSAIENCHITGLDDCNAAHNLMVCALGDYRKRK
uniref:Uncharacterized protein n=1 Tax=Trichogramma kaykai TaxID=54128 RepID=A0ABD2XA77_9HYME